MALTPISNGDSGSSARTKINDAFTAVDLKADTSNPEFFGRVNILGGGITSGLLHIYDADSSNSVRLITSSSLAADYTLTLPAITATVFTDAGGTMTGALTIGVGTLATAALSLSQTWNSVGTTCRGFDVAITDTNSAAASTAFRILTGAAGATQVCSVDKDGMPTFRVTTGHFLKMYGGVGSGIGLAGEFSSGGVRSGYAFNCGDGFAPLIHAVSGGTTCLFGAGGTFGSPASLAPNFMGIAHSSSVATMTFGAVDKDYNGAYTGAGHNCVFRGGRGTAQGTGSAGGSASLRGGNARGGGNNNGGDVIIQGGDPTGSGTRGQISILNLPTSSAGLSTGMIWNDAGTLKVA